jgi:fumarate reductase subunit D
MVKGRPKEPFVWALFSGGGMAAAMLLPATAAVLWLAMPLGWVPPLDVERAAAAAAHPLTRLVIGVLVVLFLFHWAHRFRYTLYDGLQLYHLNRFIALVTYGLALLLSGGAAWILWTLG